MFVDAITFAASAVLIGGVRVEDPPVDREGAAPLLHRAREGMVLVLRHPYLRVSLAFATTVNFFSFVVAALLVLFASRHLGLSPGAIGLALGIGASGGLLGAVLSRRATALLGVGRTIMVGGVLFSAPVALLPVAQGPLWARAGVLGLVEFVTGLGVMWLDVPLNALQTAVVPDDVRSRVTGAFATVNYGVRPLGAVLGGFLGEWIGVTPTLCVGAAGGTLAVLWLVGSPILRTRTMDDLDGVAEAVGGGRRAPAG
jgi:predicted MFS family arabinose efflux permease